MQDKFIDLCVDDNHSAYGNEMPQRQERFRAHLEKLNFRFQTSRLDLPNGMVASNNNAGIDIAALKEIDFAMGENLDAINELLESEARQ